MSNITCIIEEMDLTKLSKAELLEKCEKLGIKKCKSKNKSELIYIINHKTHPNPIEFIIGGDASEETTNNISEILTEVSTEGNKIVTSTVTNNSNKIKHLKPLVKWSGGKSDEIKMFEKYFPGHYTR